MSSPAAATESVWDYPRPPRVERVEARVRIEFGGGLVADTRDAMRVLETSHPPVYYIPAEAFIDGALRPARGASWCEFKGRAAYLTVVGTDGSVAESAAWTYPTPAAGYSELRGRVAVYPKRMDRCEVAGETVTAQEGDFYGGWITSAIRGPFKGGPGTAGW